MWPEWFVDLFSQIKNHKVPEITSQIQSLIDQVFDLNKNLIDTQDNQRLLVKMIAEQVAFTTGDTNWGLKSAAKNNPQGPSQIAYNQTPLVCWRIIGIEGARPGLDIGPTHPPIFLPIPGQVFIPVVPTNHLSSGVTNAVQQTQQTDVEREARDQQIIDVTQDLEKIHADNDRILQLLDNMNKTIIDNQTRIDEISRKVDRRLITKFFGATVVISPEGN